MNQQEIINAWLEVFPDSSAVVSPVLDSFSARFFLTKDKTECSNGIRDNDPFSYSAIIDSNFTEMREHRLSMLVNPTNKYCVYGLINLRKQTIKDITHKKLVARFKKIKQWLASNADQVHDGHKHLINKFIN